MDGKRKKEKLNMSNLEEPKLTEILAGTIVVYDSAWKDCNQTLDSLLSIDKNDSILAQFNPSQTNEDYESGDKYRQSVRTSYGFSLGKAASLNKTAEKIYKDLDKLVSLATEQYRKIFKINEEIKNAEGYSLLRYEAKQKYNFHYDGGTESARAISVLLYLNDDYSGGELEFPNFNIKIKPKAGTMFLFPSNYAYAHIAHPVELGTKYVIATWLKDR